MYALSKKKRHDSSAMEKGIAELIKQVKTHSKADVRFQSSVAKELAHHFDEQLENVVEKIVAHMEYQDKKMISSQMVKSALKAKVYNADDLVMKKTSFKNYVKDLVNTVMRHKADVKIGKEAIEMLQAYYENRVMKALIFLIRHTMMSDKKTVKADFVKLLENVDMICKSK